MQSILRGPFYCCLAASLRSRSSAIVNLTPFPRGRDTHGLLPLPMMNTLTNLQTLKGTNQESSSHIFQLDLVDVLNTHENTKQN